jgi:hypothetical protein
VESGTATWVADTTGVNWATIVYGPFTPDHGTLITGDTLYHSYLIQGDATLNNAAGTGLLAVTGNLSTRGVARWDGVVLVGGEIFFGANSGDSTAFFGMVVSGLREQIGSAPYAQIGAYPVYIRYDSCKIRRALAPLAGFAPIPSAWVDNWAGY